MRRPAVSVLMVALVAGGPVAAELCSVDTVPAASLLLPYFEVDLSDRDGLNGPDCARNHKTVFTVANASAAPALAHVTLWTDWGYPTFNFDIFLTGYDVVSYDLCRIIGHGIIRRTADETFDVNDTFSPHQGANSNNPSWDGSFPRCANGFLPHPPIGRKVVLNRIQNAHAGYPVPTLGGDCVGEGLNGSGQCANGSCPLGTIARGYVTIDSVSDCTKKFPTDLGYYTNFLSNDNFLWGDYFFVDPANNFASGDNLVRIEAHDLLNQKTIPVLDPAKPRPVDPTEVPVATVANDNRYTFYGRYALTPATSQPTGIDNREPLASAWLSPYHTSGGGTSLTVWRDSTQGQVDLTTGFTCGLCAFGAGPPWCPLDETQVVCFDEAEDAVELCFGGSTDPFCFPLQAQRVEVGVGALAPPASDGWCFLNLNHACPTCVPGSFGAGADIAQSHVGARQNSLGRFSTTAPAIAFASACSD